MAQLTQAIDQELGKSVEACRRMTHPGVGAANRSVFRIDHWKSLAPSCGKQIASYLGLVPVENSSGEWRRLGHIIKQGSSMQRFLLVKLAQVTVRSIPEWRYQCFHLAMPRGRKIAKSPWTRKVWAERPSVANKIEYWRIMSLRSLLCSIFPLLLTLPLHGGKVEAPIAITHVNVIAMTGDGALRDQTVLIEDGRIAKIGAAGGVHVARGSFTVDGRGRYLIPGLVDAHVHLYAPEHFHLYVANGVTTVLNLNGRPLHLAWRQEVAEGARLGPRIYTVGPKFDRADPPEKAVELVDQYSKQGYDGIKIYNQVTKAEYPALIAEAKKHHMLIVGHIAREPGFEATVQAGQAIAHAEEYLYTFFQEHSKDGAPDPAFISQAAALTKSSGVPVIATLVTYEHIIEQATDLQAFLQRPEAGYLEPWQIADLKAPAQNPYLNFDKDGIAELQRNYPFQQKLVKALLDGGVPILVGTDSGAGTSVPGFAVHEELEILVKSGLTPFEALQCATVAPARFLRGSDQFGTVEEGKAADLVLLRANPLDDIANTRQIAGVVVRGKWFDRPQLDLMLEQVPSSYVHDEEKARAKFRANPEQAVAFLKTIDPFFQLGSAIVTDAAIQGGIGRLEPLIRRVTKDDPDSPLSNPELLNDIADYLLEKRQADDAIELYRFNIAEHPRAAIAYDRLARAYYKLGKHELSLKYYQEALEVDPNYWNAGTAKRRIAELAKKSN